MSTTSSTNLVHTPRPSQRRLRAFAFDPILSQRIETHAINEITIGLPWDENLGPGPVDEYLEVVDVDPASQVVYAPVDLNNPYLLGQDGLQPWEGNPQFHQQMVYAVARTTINHFEQALGRRAFWSPHIASPDSEREVEFVGRLRIYPHALREANAYYTPDKKALLFGYFPASANNPGENLPGGIVFSCLSHDIIAHETTHALLDGLHRRFIEPTNIDSWAFHEAFADIVALFQHFTYPEVLRSQIARTRGSLNTQNLLGELAYQFGQAIGRYGALRSALGHVDPATKQWVPDQPDPGLLLTTSEPHDRGSILVAAVFDAFLAIYQNRTSDLIRIATGGTGVLPPGNLHPDLVNRLAQEAAKAAGHILQMCIRALDYCPPVDLDYGDYLRALVTADTNLVGDDSRGYRVAVIEAFRRRGIYPHDVRSLSQESLIWHVPGDEEQRAFKQVFGNPARLRQLVPDWSMTTERQKIFDQAQRGQALLHNRFASPEAADAARAAQLVLDKETKVSFYRNKTDGIPTFEVHAVRPSGRIGPNNETVNELVIEMTQRRRGYLDPGVQEQVDSGAIDPPKPDFIFRGGCTILVDRDTANVRYCIYKRILSQGRLERTRHHLNGDSRPSLRATYLGDPRSSYFQRMVSGMREGSEEASIEPFALLHRSLEGEEDQP